MRHIAMKTGESSRARVAAVVCNCGSSGVMFMVMLTPQLRYVPETDAKLLC